MDMARQAFYGRFAPEFTEAEKRAKEDAALVEQTRRECVAEFERDRMSKEGAWHWMNDGNDHLESLACPVLIEANYLRELLAAQKSATLREVGEALDSLVTETGMPLFVDYKHVDALRQGKWPKGW